MLCRDPPGVFCKTRVTFLFNPRSWSTKRRTSSPTPNALISVLRGDNEGRSDVLSSYVRRDGSSSENFKLSLLSPREEDAHVGAMDKPFLWLLCHEDNEKSPIGLSPPNSRKNYEPHPWKLYCEPNFGSVVLSLGQTPLPWELTTKSLKFMKAEFSFTEQIILVDSLSVLSKARLPLCFGGMVDLEQPLTIIGVHYKDRFVAEERFCAQMKTLIGELIGEVNMKATICSLDVGEEETVSPFSLFMSILRQKQSRDDGKVVPLANGKPAEDKEYTAHHFQKSADLMAKIAKGISKMKENTKVKQFLMNFGYILESDISYLVGDDCRDFLVDIGYMLRIETRSKPVILIPELLPTLDSPLVFPSENVVIVEPIFFWTEKYDYGPASVFYEWAVKLTNVYPLSVQFRKFAAQLQVDRYHTLIIKYRKYCLEAAVVVTTKGSTLSSTRTKKVCCNIFKTIFDKLRDTNKECGIVGKARFGVCRMPVVEQLGPVDLIDITDAREHKKCYQVFEEVEYSPPELIYCWLVENAPQTVIEREFSSWCQRLTPSFVSKLMTQLIPMKLLTSEEVKTIYQISQNDDRVQYLLHCLIRRGREGDDAFNECIAKIGQMNLAAGQPSLQQNTPSPGQEIPAISNESSQLLQPAVTVLSRGVAEVETANELQETSFARGRVGIAQPSDAHDRYTPTVVSTRNFAPTAPERNTTESLVRSPPQEQVSRPPQERVSIEPPIQPRAESSAKRDPQVTAIFEAKYYHVERASDYFNERPFREGGKRLGSGSFGTVYHGVLHSENGEKFEVAIKRLKKAASLNPVQFELSRKQFGVEMNILTRYCHKNIVSLIGFSSDGPELCLIFEYLSNGALSHRLDCRDKTAPLPWDVRLTISLDIARGLHFLHDEYKLPVIHRDVKSSNVLLTSKFEAKLSDFGLAMVGSEESGVSAGPSVGTRPYMAPEIFNKIISPKGDVYGLGIIYYELATGLPPFSSKKKQDLKSYVDEIEQQGIDLTKMLDPKAKWPKRKEKGKSPGLQLLDIAKLASNKDYTIRCSISELLPHLRQLALANW